MTIQIFFGLIGGLGLFLFGMQKMAEGLQNAAGDRLRQILELFTSKPIIAVFTGALATVLVQSSSTTTVMVVGFVNAGLMNLTQAIGTIMGANIGTTITAQIVSFNIFVVALPAIGFGGIVNFLSRKRFPKYMGLGILGFGMLILGMDIMGTAVNPLREFPPFLDMLVTFGQTPILGVLAGAAFTLLVQSSSATTGLVIAFSLQGLIGLDSAIALILGANIGTCITAILASLGTGLTARRAAVAHVLFNMFGVILFMILLKPFTHIVALTSTNITRQIANAHTIFNVTNTILLFPFIKHFANMVHRIVPGEEAVIDLKPQYLDENMLNSPAALIAVTKETLRMAEISKEMLHDAFHSFVKGDEKLIENVLRKEEVVNILEKEIIIYLTKAGVNPWTDKQHKQITNLLHSAHDIERVGDLSCNIVELSQSKINHKLNISEIAINELQVMYDKVESIYNRAIKVLRSEKVDEAYQLIREDDVVDQMEKNYRESHINRLNEGKCHPESGVLFLDLVSNLERVADHANNLAEAVTGALLEPHESQQNRNY